MRSLEEQPVIIHNLDVDKVTWASTYCDNARSVGLRTSESVNSGDISAVFIGDRIGYRQLAYLKRSGYFLGACEGDSLERENIINTDATFLVSSTEKTKIKYLLGDPAPDKLNVAGFPVDITLLQGYTKKWGEKLDRSVCFLGETRPEKNPEFELEVAGLLMESGYQCFHFSPTEISYGEKLSRLGVKVVEGLRGEDYYKNASLMQYAVCCSHRESLYVSGIEVAIMGSVPILPHNEESGYVDWCPRELMYDYPIPESVLYLIGNVGDDKKGVINTDFYNKNSYFDRIKQEMEVRNG
jgi:hypothetical protein